MSKFQYRILTFCWLTFVIALHFIPGQEFPTSSWIQDYHIDKVVHLIMFAVLSFGVFKSFDSFNKKHIVFILIGLAFLLELIQGTIIANRSGDVIDFIADVSGVFLGIVIIKMK